MGRYIDWQAVANRYPAITKLGGATDIGSSFISGAEDELDARLSLRYTVPFSPAPGMVVDLATDLTYWRATMTQESAKVLKQSIDERIKGIVNGTIALIADGAVLGTVSQVSVDTSGFRSTFGHDSPEEWEPDQDMIQQEQDARD